MTSPAKTNSPRFSFGFAFRFAITLGLLVWVVSQVDVSEVSSVLSRAQAGPFAALGAIAFALVLFERVVCTWRWQILLRASRIDIGFWPLWKIQLTSGLIGSFLPTSFAPDGLRMFAIARQTDTPIEAIGASAADRIVMVLATLLLACAASVAGMGTYFPQSVAWITLPLFLVGVLGSTLLISGTGVRWSGLAVRKVAGQSVQRKFDALSQSFVALRGHGFTLVICFAVCLATLYLRVLILYFQLKAFAIEVDLYQLMLAYMVASVALMLPISIGGFGLQEGTFVVVLGWLGIDPASALGVSLLGQIQTRVVHLPGLYYYLRYGIRAAPAREGELSRSKTAHCTAHDESQREACSPDSETFVPGSVGNIHESA